MIELIDAIPPHVIGFVASGKVTKNDYETVLIPVVESWLLQHEKARILYHLGPRFTGFTSGAIWDDAMLAFGNRKSWEKIAIVSDLEWISSASSIFKFAIPCPLKVFSNSQYAEAVSWVAED